MEDVAGREVDGVGGAGVGAAGASDSSLGITFERGAVYPSTLSIYSCAGDFHMEIADPVRLMLPILPQIPRDTVYAKCGILRP